MSHPTDSFTQHDTLTSGQQQSSHQQTKRFKEIQANIVTIKSFIQDLNKRENPPTVTELMDLIQLIIFSCGGEKKVIFLEAGWNVIKAKTRVPLTANLYAFLPDTHQDNHRFHKVVMEILVESNYVISVKWFPTESRESILLVDLNIGREK